MSVTLSICFRCFRIMFQCQCQQACINHLACDHWVQSHKAPAAVYVYRICPETYKAAGSLMSHVRSKYTPEEARAAEIVMTADGLIYKYKSPVQLVAQAQATAASASSSEPTSVPPYDPNPLVVSAAASVDLEVPSVAEPADLETGPLASNSDSAETPRTTGNRKLKTVFGIDDRREITSKQSFPWRAVGLIRYKNDLGNWACSGSIIGPKAVITAAHCHLGSKGNVASTWTFYPNHLRTSGAVYGSATHIRIIANSNYWNQPEWWLWDMAIVIVNRAIGTELGYFGYQWSSAGYTGSLVTAGYPGDKPYGSFWYIGGGTACYVKDTNGNDALMTHQCDSRPGQSGSPYWIPNAHMLRAVESAENPSWNTACAINKYWYDFITTHRMRTS